MKNDTCCSNLLNGAEIAVKTLEALNIELIFAYPGASSIEMHQALIESPIRVVLPRHEQGGAFAAGGYARAAGKVGVCMSTSGPGATNLLTAVADAYADSVPLIVLTGQVDSAKIGSNAFQEVDIIGMSRPVVKHSYLLTATEEIAPTLVEAFRIASSGRPGPVWIDMPRNVLMRRIEYRPAPETAPANTPSKKDLTEKIDAMRAAILASERPCIIAGGGIILAGAAEELLNFAESCSIPVATSLMGIGCFPEHHELALRFMGMHGACSANFAVNESDLILALGARFSDRSTGSVTHFAPGAKIIHVDIDNSEINKNIHADLEIVVDVKTVLTQLNQHPVKRDRTAWLQQIAAWKKQYPFSYHREHDELKAQEVIEAISRQTGGKATVVTGVGQHQMWTAQFYGFSRPRQLLTSGGLGTMGFGLPAAMGAKLALPEETIINIDGDGSFQMNIQELGTIAAEDIGVKMVILNNQHLGMVAQMEDRFFNRCRGNTDLRVKNHRNGPSFTGIAASYGIPGRDVYSPGELEEAIREMLDTPGPFLLDCHIEYSDHVLPMIPSGKSCKEAILPPSA